MKGFMREEIQNIIESMGYPCAYYQFQDGTAQTPPFICWFFAINTDVKADNSNYVDKEQLEVELYTSYRDFEAEKAVEDVLSSYGFVYSKEPNYIDSEKIWQIAYEMEVIINESEEQS